MSRLRSESLLFVLILSATLMLFLHQLRVLQPVEDLALIVLSPVQDVINQIAGGLNGAFAEFHDAQEWRKRYEERQALIDQLLIENTRLRDKEQENATLRELLAFKQANPTYQFLAAEVIGRDPNPLLRTITIDRGSSDGLTRGMVVITARGLVGQVSEVSLRSAKIMLITDLASSVTALIQESRAVGIVQGDINGRLWMRYIPQGASVEQGNIILTSGLGGRFPKRLVIGQVENVQVRDVDLFQSAEIRPSVDFHALEAVLVITNFPAEP